MLKPTSFEPSLPARTQYSLPDSFNLYPAILLPPKYADRVPKSFAVGAFHPVLAIFLLSVAAYQLYNNPYPQIVSLIVVVVVVVPLSVVVVVVAGAAVVVVVVAVAAAVDQHIADKG